MRWRNGDRRWTSLPLAAAAGLIVLSGGAAWALSEWWTPTGMTCPAFNSKIACQAFCAADTSRCGGSTSCNFKTGPAQPECSVPPPPKSDGADGWQRNDGR